MEWEKGGRVGKRRKRGGKNGGKEKKGGKRKKKREFVFQLLVLAHKGTIKYFFPTKGKGIRE